MVSKDISRNKKNGVYYTPNQLAIYVVKPLINKTNLSIFDPAYGRGSLLLAAETILRRKKFIKFGSYKFYGCDISPANKQLRQLPNSKFIKMNFFNSSFKHKFDVILMNPPYIRHHLLDKAKRKKYLNVVSKVFNIKKTSDLWAYFLVKSISHLNKDGSIGAILPWSFLQADYSHGLRVWLAENFSKIKVLALGAEFFEDAQERIILVWLQKFGKPSKSIKFAFSQHISHDFEYFNLTKSQFCARKVMYSENYDVIDILERYKNNYNFQEFGNFADVSIGVVTGADSFFILDNEKTHEYGFLYRHLIPIFTSFNSFSGLSVNGNYPTKRLLRLSLHNYDRYRHYIAKGRKEGYHLRAHSLLRNPWYEVKTDRIPDAFFPYRVSQIPYLVINDQNVQSTNSIHRIYFRNLTKNEKKWIQISLLSVPGQLSLEFDSKTYGSGILKIEPGSLKRSLSYKGDGKSVDLVYKKITSFISSNDKISAMELATDFINKKLKISKKFSKTAKSALIELQNRRLER